jgi:hypothetical protein
MKPLLAASLALLTSLLVAQQPTPKATPSKPAAKKTQGSEYKLLDSDKVIFAAIAAIDRYEADAEKPPTEESSEFKKQALSALNKVTDSALRPYLLMMMTRINLIVLGEMQRYLGHEEKRFAEDIAQYHKLRDGIVEQIKANRCCSMPPGYDYTK